MTGTVYRQAPDVVFSEVGADVVALHIERGQCYGMEKVGSAIWKLLAEPCDLESICAGLIDQYEVDLGQCRAEVGSFLERLRNEGLVESDA